MKAADAADISSTDSNTPEVTKTKTVKKIAEASKPETAVKTKVASKEVNKTAKSLVHLRVNLRMIKVGLSSNKRRLLLKDLLTLVMVVKWQP